MDQDQASDSTAVNVFDGVQRVRPLPELRTEVDDWTGVTGTQERKKRQNRLNQRAWRRRKAAAIAGSSNLASSTSTNPPANLCPNLNGPGALFARQAVFGDGGLLLLHYPGEAERILNLMKQALEDYSLHSSRPSSLHITIRLNVLNAIADNATLIGFPKEAFCRDEFISPFGQIGPNLGNLPVPLHNCPGSLWPTHMQRTVPHHPWIDLFPFPIFRDNVLRGMQEGMFDDDDLCYDLLGFDSTGPGEQPSLIVWTEAWDPRGWEINEAFLRKWGRLVRGCPEILVATNYWRLKRGQTRLLTEFTE
ncbi:hypothetical protein BGZ61DRAFT_507628 [Ilyonectria robusta]|uniref:uncharacterized protein n=1 Tax=Ilyonectria robusta TaxID=1079257 RepID=UPI001E8CAC83|nr:uncharacterized protein BGZ61DRAFT_507628 [Ilyonectria robusta]KAH8684130.1 hypothetical protein BGZ61DRAFT_507628 [Ilyonectria robusta]